MAARLIIIDDDAHLRLLYQKELSRAGYLVDTAALGAEAVAKLSQNKFDLAIVDIEMPDVSGLDLLGQLKELAPQMPVILNSAYTTYKADFKTWLADAYLVKSSDLSQLHEEIKRLLAPSHDTKR